jgi:hypothetical protein
MTNDKYTFASRVVPELKRSFSERFDHHPSMDQMDALVEIVLATGDILTGGRAGQFILSSCDAGLGKTQTLIHCIREIMTNPAWKDRSVLVCIPRIDEIKAFLRELGEAPGDDFAVLVNAHEKELRAAGRGHENSSNARLLISTQAAVRKLLKGCKRLADVPELSYEGRLRTIKYWDEFLQHSIDFAIPTTSLHILGGELGDSRSPYFTIGQDILSLIMSTGPAVDGETIIAPDFADKHADVDVAVLKAHLNSHGGAAKDLGDVLENLWEVSGLPLKVHKSQGRSSAIITFREYLPADFAPVIVTDASGRVRQLYDEIKTNGCQLVELGRAVKNYSPFKVHLWDRSAAKHVFSKGRNGTPANPDDVEEIAGEMAKVVRSKAPRGRWLVICHGGERSRGKLVDFGALLQAELVDLSPVFVDHTYLPDPDRQAELAKLEAQGLTVAVLNWGRHDATSAFKLFDKTIMIGCQYDPDAVVEAKVRANGRIPVDVPIPEERMKEARLGELKHHVLQGHNRGGIRGSDGDKCTPGEAWHVASAASGVTKDLYREDFPECVVKDWTPVEKKIRSKRILEALEIIKAHFKRTKEALRFSIVYNAMAMAKGDFRTRVRRNVQFQREMSKLGICEVGNTFDLSYRAYGFEDDFEIAA